MRTVRFETLGCRLNQADTALMTDRLNRNGYDTLYASEFPDVLIVNTCAVTGTAVQKSRQALRRLRKRFPGAVLVVTGCAVNLDSPVFEAESDVLLPASKRSELPELLDAFFAGKPLCVEPDTQLSRAHTFFSEQALAQYPFKTRAFLKIQEGCNNFCSYCIVPYARGAERSRMEQEVFEDFRALLDAGHKEIVLAGVNTGSFQWSGGGLAAFVEKLLQTPGDFRIRLSSVEPHPTVFELAGLMAAYPEKLCRFLHLPAQHLSENVLKLMNRHYLLEDYVSMVETVQQKVPGIHVGTDFIVGFPGETEADFETSLSLAQRLGYANIHVFPFSVREGTKAAAMKQTVTPAQVSERVVRLTVLAEKSAKAFALSQCGKLCRVLVEKAEKGIAEGWSDHYLRIRFPFDSGAERGCLAGVVPDGLTPDGILSGFCSE